MRNAIKGVLRWDWLVPGDLCDRFNAWYGLEHLADVTRVPGVLRGCQLRVCSECPPSESEGTRFIVLYFLDNVDLYKREPFRALGAAPTPETQFMTSHLAGRSDIWRAGDGDLSDVDAVEGCDLFESQYPDLSASSAARRELAAHPAVVARHRFQHVKGWAVGNAGRTSSQVLELIWLPPAAARSDPPAAFAGSTSSAACRLVRGISHESALSSGRPTVYG